MDFLKNVFVPGGAEREARRRHTAEMYERVPEVEKLERGKYSLILNCPNGQVSTLFITLIATFPEMKPIFTVRGPLQHPWIDKYRFVTGCDNLNNWHRETSRLADVVIEIKQILECGWNVPEDKRNDRQEVTLMDSNAGGGATTSIDDRNVNQDFTPSSAGASSSSSATVSTGTSTKSVPALLPDIPQDFEKLNDLSDEQLMRLLDDEVAFDLFVKELDIGTDVKKMREAIEKENLENARSNLTREKELTDLHNEVSVLQNKLQVEIRAYNEKLEESSKKYTLSGEEIRNQLEDASNTIDLNSEDLGEEFVHGSRPMQEFLKEYTEMREHYHSLRAKLDALS